MEPSDLLNIEQQSFTLSENVKKLINNRTENVTRLREQRKNCYTEMKAFRNDLNKFLDKIEDEFFNELSMLEREQIDKIQSVVWELGNITKAVENVKMQLKEIKNCASSKDMNESKLNTLQQIKRSLSENELNVYAKCNTLTDGSGWKEIDINMAPDPALQIVTSKIKSLGEVFITTCPVSIALDGKKPVVEDIEMTEENKPENEDKEKEKEKEAPTSMDLPTDIHMQSKAQSPISPMKATNIDLKTLITKKSIIQTWPKTERDKASRERNFFNTVVRNVVQTTGIRSIKGDNFNTLFSKVKQCIPNISLEEQQVESFYRRALINFMSYKRKREQDYIPGGQKNPRSIYSTDVLQYELLKSGTDVCLSDGDSPVAKAKIIYYPAMELGMNKEQQREFASVQILLKRRNADVSKLPFLDDIRSWKDIGKDSKISWRITDIRPIDYYEKSIKQVSLHRRSIARREKMQALKGPNQPESDNIDQKPINQTSVNCEPLNNTPVNHPTDKEGSDVQEPTYNEPINPTPVNQESSNEEDVNHEPLNNTPVNHPTDKEGSNVQEPTYIEPINPTPVNQESSNEEDVKHEPLNNTPVNHPTDKEGSDVHEPTTIEPINLTPVKQECSNKEDVNHEPLNNTPVNHLTDNEGPDVHEPATIEPINLTPVKQECSNEEDVNHEPLNNTRVNHLTDNEGPDVHEPATIEPINLTPVKQECSNEEDVNHEPLNNTPVNHLTDNEGPDVHEPATIEPINKDCNSGAKKNPRRIIYPTDVVHFALLKSGTNVCLCDGEFPVGKAKIMFYPDINLDMTENQQREFTSVQILLKRRNADVPKLPFLDDIRSWKDIRRRSKISWRITDIRPLDYYEKYIKQGDLHRRSIARRVKKQSEKGPYQLEPDNICQKSIHQTSVNCGPLNNMPVSHPSDNEGSDVQKPTYIVNQESYNEEDVNHEPLNNMPVNHPTDNEGFDDQEPTNIELIKQEN